MSRPGRRLFTGVADVDLEPVSSTSTELVSHLTYRVVTYRVVH
jgi:hypothetical protein